MYHAKSRSNLNGTKAEEQPGVRRTIYQHFNHSATYCIAYSYNLETSTEQAWDYTYWATEEKLGLWN
jgi:hypothetical protein